MSTKTNISAVDDNKAILLLIEAEFESDHEYNFRYYSEGQAFLNDLDSSVDLVVLDIHIPGFNVIQAVEKVDEVAPMAYVIIISGDKDFDQLKDLTNLGIFRYCHKDENNFLFNLRNYIKAAHRKITIRKGVLDGN